MPKDDFINIYKRIIFLKNTNTHRMALIISSASLLLFMQANPSSSSFSSHFRTFFAELSVYVRETNQSNRSVPLPGFSLDCHWMFSYSCTWKRINETNGLKKLCIGVGSTTIPFECDWILHRREKEKTNWESTSSLIQLCCPNRKLPSFIDVDDTVSYSSQWSSPWRTSICDRSISYSTCSSDSFYLDWCEISIEFNNLDFESWSIESIIVNKSDFRKFSSNRKMFDVIDHSMGSSHSQLESMDWIKYRWRTIGMCDHGID